MSYFKQMVEMMDMVPSRLSPVPASSQTSKTASSVHLATSDNIEQIQ